MITEGTGLFPWRWGKNKRAACDQQTNRVGSGGLRDACSTDFSTDGEEGFSGTEQALKCFTNAQ